MKTVHIEYEGKKIPIKLNDELSFGELDDIVNKNIKADNIMNGQIKIDIVNYRYQLALAVIKEAPWKVNDLRALKDLPLKTGRQVVKEAAKLFPLKDCLLDWVSTFAGEMTPEQKKMMQESITDMLS